ncbi:autotransporter outer membrane beta-barrel domain-containing protein [Ochrobactrum teleogrylli]|uniref:Autotransporter outer membrane beta-barrel domain-containing protein n=1 Tax=Ochrobactrum teleogrylli TaxID=2479765 RepID=A0ABY2YA40_9HYPH|nr:autotransporter outer membrane beta-barrel domain-containing protein [[Ochrobactrum] teleogrylli]TNV17775.1 autotransporter outer membrane beta-barrel domain-containing protein [[Ochrobactrum] teleogrylli]
MHLGIRRVSATLLLSTTALFTVGAVLLPSGNAQAACSFSPTAGDDVFICDSGTSASGLTDTSGNNTLLLPTGGSGTVNGNVTFGAGTDRVELHSGSIAGSIDQGDGADAFIISGGSVVGNVQQGGGIDDFQMTGGQIISLNQGDGLDTFFMSDGRIIDAFDDGDYAVMTGGRIGRVNMKLDNNYFNMSGGTIDRNLVTGFGNDTIIISSGMIGGSISVSGGTDSVTITGGTVAGDIMLSFGTDTFSWNGGGILYGNVDLGADDDVATLTNLTDANMGSTKFITGGEGTDSLSFSNVKTGAVYRFGGWETINLTNDTRLVFNAPLTLGDAGTGKGTLNIDATSTIYGGSAQSVIKPYAAMQLTNVFNAGRIDLTNGGSSTTDSLTIRGNYTGQNGLLFLDTVLAGDASPSDKLVIDGGSASGNTGIVVENIGGAGASTVSNGIMVVETLNGATTTAGAFTLNGRVAAGAYEYYLFKGGVSAGTTENWYLRSTLVNGSQPAAVGSDAPEPEAPETVAAPPPLDQPAAVLPVDPNDPDPQDNSAPVAGNSAAPTAPPAPQAADVADPPDNSVDGLMQPPLPGNGVAPPSAGATRVEGDVVNLYREEVPVYSALPPVAHHLALSTLGTFHERRGEQDLLESGGYLPSSWVRVFGQDIDMKWRGTVAPGVDGSLLGIQAGQDLFGRESDGGHFDRFGVFFGYARASGDITGQALGLNDLAVGDLDVTGTSFGGYWTHIGPQGWYLDAVVMGTWFDGSASSNAQQGIDLEGHGVTASLEGGYPLALGGNWTLEPQAQLIWQHLSLDDQADRYSTVTFDSDNAWTGRIGMRLQGAEETSFGKLRPYLKANLWQNFSSDQTVSFGTDPIVTNLKGTSLEVGGGITVDITEKASLFATADYTTNLGGERTRIWEGNIGLNVKW